MKEMKWNYRLLRMKQLPPKEIFCFRKKRIVETKSNTADVGLEMFCLKRNPSVQFPPREMMLCEIMCWPLSVPFLVWTFKEKNLTATVKQAVHGAVGTKVPFRAPAGKL